MIVPQPSRQVISDSETDVLWRQSAGMDNFLRCLRERGAGKIESIKALRRLTSISLGDAKEIVHFSPAWADTRAADDAFHDSLYEACEQLMREERSEAVAS